MVTETFKLQAATKHFGKYDYSQTEYIHSRKKLKIICPTHGVFLIRADSHLRGCGCSKCSTFKRTKTKEQFILEASEKHDNFYNYDNVLYKNEHTLVEIICPSHGSFKQSPSNHLAGNTCPICSNKFKHTTEYFIQRAQETHGISTYDYSLVNYISAKIKILIKCNSCNDIFLQAPDKHLRGQGCKKCKSSNGELMILKFLKTHNIKFKPQYFDKSCALVRPLRFDFAIYDKNNILVCLIEYQGQQHYYPVCFGGMSLEQAESNFAISIKRDEIKEKFCIRNEICLIKLNYKQYGKLNEILLELLMKVSI